MDCNKEHGSPYDRGVADSYYGRVQTPHCGGVGGTSGPRIGAGWLTPEEIAEYHAGYAANEKSDEKKDWG
jgi:hypothetical protein